MWIFFFKIKVTQNIKAANVISQIKERNRKAFFQRNILWSMTKSRMTAREVKYNNEKKKL